MGVEEVERWLLGLAQRYHLVSEHLDARRGARLTATVPINGYHPFAVDCTKADFARNDDLRLSAPVPEDQEPDAAEIPDAMDPSLKMHLLLYTIHQFRR